MGPCFLKDIISITDTIETLSIRRDFDFWESICLIMNFYYANC